MTTSMMKKMLSTLAVGALLVTGLAQAAPKAKEKCPHVEPVKKGLATDKGYKLSQKMPKMKTKPSVKVSTWADQVVIDRQPPRRTSDPYEVTLKGYHNGAKFEVHQELMADAIQLPTEQRKIIPKASERKKANKAYNKALALAVAKSEKSKVIHTGEINVNGPAFEEKITKPEELAVGAPIKILGRDRFGRKYVVATTNTVGLPTVALDQRHYVGNDIHQNFRGGEFTAQGEAWIQPKNLFSTPAFVKDNNTFAKIMGIKAFAPGSTVTIKNLRMIGEGLDVASATVSFVAKKGSTPNHGVGGVFVPGIQDDKLQVTVQLPGTRAAAKTYELRIPKQKGRPDISARGVKYFRVEKPTIEVAAAQ